MAAFATTSAISSAVAAPSRIEFQGLRATKPAAKVMIAPIKAKGALGARCDYIGSSTNVIVVASTALFLVAGRFGLAPSANKEASAGLKLSERATGLQTGDPAGFTATDVLAFGALGHIFGVGLVLGLKATGSL